MADTGNFERLAASLTLNERQNLLEKLKDQSKISMEPLYVVSEDESVLPDSDAGTGYNSLPWYYRLWFFILSFIKGKSPLKIYDETQVAILGRKIEDKSPGLFDYQKNILLPAFYTQMETLKEAARFFYSALDTGVNRDKGAFYAFLGSLEMPEVHKKLQEETTPGYIEKSYPDLPDTEMRQKALKTMEDAFYTITDECRSAMYQDARCLFCLKELSSFLFDRIIMAFSLDSSVNGYACSASLVRELLLSLNGILVSFRAVPPMSLLESLFVFILQERTTEAGFDINREIRGLLAKAEESLECIRAFNKNIPLTWIIRCSNRDMSILPRPVSGGEDWLLLYRDYWKRRIDSLFSDFMKDRRRRELLNSFRYFFKGTNLKMLENGISEINPNGLPIKGIFALSFLLTFYSMVFMPDINRILRPLLIDGDFQRKENRVEFAESYNNLIKLEDDIKKLDYQISPDGDYGKRYAQAKQDMSALPVRRRKIQIVIEDASGAVEKILEQARDASRNIINILNGILGRDTRGKYSLLANLSELSGKDNEFITGAEEAIQKFQRVLKLLDEIEAMEAGRMG